MNKRLLGIIASVIGLLSLGIAPANATNLNGSWWTSEFTCSNGIAVQGHYVNTTGFTRQDGGGGTIDSNSGFLREILFQERNEGAVLGSRTITYTGSAKTVSVTAISTALMPNMQNFQDNAQTALTRIKTSTGESCQFAWVIGNG